MFVRSEGPSTQQCMQCFDIPCENYRFRRLRAIWGTREQPPPPWRHVPLCCRKRLGKRKGVPVLPSLRGSSCPVVSSPCAIHAVPGRRLVHGAPANDESIEAVRFVHVRRPASLRLGRKAAVRARRVAVRAEQGSEIEVREFLRHLSRRSPADVPRAG